MLGQVLPLVEKDDLWIADRNFCTVAFLCGIAARGGSFVIASMASSGGPWSVQRIFQGSIDTGAVYEQQLRLVNGQGDTVTLRRITIALHEPTRAGDTDSTC